MNRAYSHWEEIYDAYGKIEWWICHKCGYMVNRVSNFCPECGRIMTGCKKDGKYTINFDIEKIKKYCADNESVLNN